MGYKVTVDKEKRLVTQVVEGNPTVEEALQIVEEFRKITEIFKPGEAMLLNDMQKTSVTSPEALKVMKEGQKYFEHFGKVASVSSSILAETQYKKSGNEAGVGNRRFFKSEEEAMAWLME